jgi:hypothetical protein
MKLTINNWGQFNTYSVYDLLVYSEGKKFDKFMWFNKITILER